MRRQELKEIIAEGESITLEFKRKFTSQEKFAKEIIAFANTKGGYLLIGVDDDGSIVGVNSEKEEIDLMTTACEFCIEPPISPEIEVVQIEFKDVIVAYIPQSSCKPHRLVSQNADEKPHERLAFIRQGENSVVASKEMTKVMAAQNLNAKPITLSIGNNEKRLFEYFEINEKITLKEYSKLINVSERRALRLLIRLIQAGSIQIHTHEKTDFFTLSS